MEERLNKWKLPDLHRLMDLVDLPRGSGDKVTHYSCLLRKPIVLQHEASANTANYALEVLLLVAAQNVIIAYVELTGNCRGHSKSGVWP